MKYHAITVVSFGPGTELGLSPAQAAPRAGCLSAVAGRDGWYVTTSPVQFKRGEVFLHDSDLPKSMAHMVESEDAPKPGSHIKRKAKSKTDANPDAGSHV